MPLDPAYLERAQHNELYLATFDIHNSDFLDWAVVAAFYVAVRYVDAYFYPNKPVDHEERNRRVRTDSRTRRIADEYRLLYDRSRDARYELVDFNSQEVDSLIQNRLKLVQTHMQRQ